MIGFKKCHGIKEFVAHGEGGSVMLSGDIWDKFTTMKTRLVGLDAKDNVNMDETGPFYKLVPNWTLAQRAVARKKRFKECIIVALTLNMCGSIKLKPLNISKSLKPRHIFIDMVLNPSKLGI
ncbi:hypothetical protein R1flu_012765 [Riccia fluitans]|uniref:Uncharacterized protein n=1 Tax=Riccia fluitans TaxID=41844 RepID=A0ABD1ZBI8_9MARC